jgi:hypothetical protein
MRLSLDVVFLLEEDQKERRGEAKHVRWPNSYVIIQRWYGQLDDVWKGMYFLTLCVMWVYFGVSS